MNRRSFQQLADLRLREADALLQVKEWSGAYYLAGYAIECGLKARVVRQFKHWDLPDLQRVKEIYTHNLEKLVSQAGLKAELADARYSGSFDINWSIIKDWTETSRYSTSTRRKATALVAAVGDAQEGVLPWLRHRW